MTAITIELLERLKDLTAKFPVYVDANQWDGHCAAAYRAAQAAVKEAESILAEEAAAAGE